MGWDVLCFLIELFSWCDLRWGVCCWVWGLTHAPGTITTVGLDMLGGRCFCTSEGTVLELEALISIVFNTVCKLIESTRKEEGRVDWGICHQAAQLDPSSVLQGAGNDPKP